MDIVVLHVADCPNLAVALTRLDEALAKTGREHVTVRVEEVRTADEARRLGFVGSPTFLIDGTDPFPAPTDQPGLACRMFPNPAGMDGAPTVARLEAALQR